ncbi:MAG TPA: imidazolonepropionase [Candidatus Acidoferrales bacterium]|nr:imidazolonepropionase [Candidatus Acidoferrales bacterium]
MAQWDTLWVGANLATLASGEADVGFIPDGAVAAENGRIAWIGPSDKLPDAPKRCAKDVVDLDPHTLVTPGLIDCHTHLVYSKDRAAEFDLRIGGLSYADIAKGGGGIQTTVQFTRASSFEDLYAQSARRLEMMMAAGVTTVEIKSGYGLDRDTELKMLRVARALGTEYPIDVRTTFLGAHTLPREFTGRRDAYVDFVCDVLREGASENLIDEVDAFCESIAFSAVEVRKVFRVAQELRIPVKVHAAQLTYGDGPMLAAAFHALSADHCEYLHDGDIELLANAGVVAVLLPTASYFIGEEQRPPVAALREAGVPIAIATDCNPGTSPNVSLPLAMNMACVRFGLHTWEALRGVTLNAARALGIGERVGSLEKGKDADFAIWQAESASELAYSFGQTRCLGTVKRGRSLAGMKT